MKCPFDVLLGVLARVGARRFPTSLPSDSPALGHTCLAYPSLFLLLGRILLI